MKAIILTCYESNEERVSFVLETLRNKYFDTEVITSDFSHIRKEKRNNIPKGYKVIETKPYDKNLSVSRMISHTKFAKDAFNYVEKQKPDLIWLMIPANSLVKEARAYKNKHHQVKLIIDIIDMWPESLPININKDLLPFKIWKNVRTNNINCADALVAECDFYHNILNKEYNKDITTIYWGRDSKTVKNKNSLPKDKLVLCYIGSINNIIGTDIIKKIIENCNMSIRLHVIGEGENKDNFINSLKNLCELIYHGAIRDENKKNEIFSMCHAGLNIYKENLYIGLTVKSIDYFEHGLPVINNIKGDTWKFVEKYNVGININSDYVLDGNRIIELRNNNDSIYDLYNNNFTKDVFITKCSKVIDEVMKQ